jgi:hypothetical protein
MTDVLMFIGFIFLRLGIPLVLLFSLGEMVRHRNLKKSHAGGD